MPINQSRVVTLVNAAIAYRNLSKRMIGWISDPRRFHGMNRDEMLGQLMNWSIEADLALTHNDAAYSPNIINEYHHFRTTAKRNERSRIKAQAIRRAMGKVQRGQPRTFAETDSLLATDELIRPSEEDTFPTSPRPAPHQLLSPELKQDLQYDEAAILRHNEIYNAMTPEQQAAWREAQQSQASPELLRDFEEDPLDSIKKEPLTFPTQTIEDTDENVETE